MKTLLLISMWLAILVSLGFVAKILMLVPAVLSLGFGLFALLAGLCWIGFESSEELERPSNDDGGGDDY